MSEGSRGARGLYPASFMTASMIRSQDACDGGAEAREVGGLGLRGTGLGLGTLP